MNFKLGTGARSCFTALTLATGLVSALSTMPLEAATVWAPMWDQRKLTVWQAKASATTVSFYTEHGGTFNVYDSSNNLLGSGDTSSPVILNTAVVGELYEMRYTSGFHVRPHWEGVDWVRTGTGKQAAGPGSNLGFQSDAELGFDHRWGHLPSQYADTTWYYNVAAGETLSISVEHMTGDVRGSKRFDWIRPDGVKVTADSNGMPGSGTLHFQARNGNLGNPPDPLSVYWEEYVAPVSMEGWWGFKLTAYDMAGQTPYSWHYVLDRTDAGSDQYHYLLAGSILDPNKPVPEPAMALLMAGALLLLALSSRLGRA